jgi:hypothetical protein
VLAARTGAVHDLLKTPEDQARPGYRPLPLGTQ